MPTNRGTRALVVAFLALMAASSAAAAPDAAMESFLLPGVDAGDIDFRVGTWCRYVIVDEAMGEVDSTLFYFAVLDRETTPRGDAFWVEIETRPAGGAPSEREVARALVSGSIRDLSRGDSLYHYVHELYIRRGSEPVEPADPLDLKRLTLANPTSQNDWARQSGINLTVPAGEMTCDFKELTVESSREVPTGSITLIQHKRDHFRVWACDDVPVFSLVKCVIERSRESRTVPPVPGIPEAGPRKSRTTAVVVEFGDGARPLIAPQ